MSGFTLYPAVDLRGGRVVRLMEGNPSRATSYSDDPAETARRWFSAGASWLHVVNLDGAFGEADADNRDALRSVLDVAQAFDALVQFGGGLRSLDSIEGALSLGVRRVVIGTLAVEKPDVLKEALAHFGPERVAVGIDARGGQVRVRGWGTESGIAAVDLARQIRTLGLRTVIFTDISRDGTGRGLNLPATRELAEASGLDVIASGGVQALDDVLATHEAGLAGLIVGRALYEGTVDLKTALQETADAGEASHSVS